MIRLLNQMGLDQMALNQLHKLLLLVGTLDKDDFKLKKPREHKPIIAG